MTNFGTPLRYPCVPLWLAIALSLGPECRINLEKEVETMETSMLTTLDNPFNPFTQFEEWNAYDMDKGYHTCSYLARIVKSSNELSEADEALRINTAMDEILRYNLTGNYTKVTMNVKDLYKEGTA